MGNPVDSSGLYKREIRDITQGDKVIIVGNDGDYPPTRVGLQDAVNASLALVQFEEADEYPADSSGKTCTIETASVNLVHVSKLIAQGTNFLTTLVDQRGVGRAKYIEITIGPVVRVEPILNILSDTELEIPKWLLEAATNVSFRLVKPVMHVIKVTDRFHLDNSLDAQDPLKNEAIYISELGTGVDGVDSHKQVAALRFIFDGEFDSGVRFESWVVSGIVEWIGARTSAPRQFRIHGDREIKSLNGSRHNDDDWIRYPHVKYYANRIYTEAHSGFASANGIWVIDNVEMDAVHNTIAASSSWESTIVNCRETVKPIDPNGLDTVVGREWLATPGLRKFYSHSSINYHHTMNALAGSVSSVFHIVAVPGFNVGGAPNSDTHIGSEFYVNNVKVKLIIKEDLSSLIANGLMDGLTMITVNGCRESNFFFDDLTFLKIGALWSVLSVITPSALLSMRNIKFIDGVASGSPVEFNFNNCIFPEFESDFDYSKWVVGSFNGADRVRDIGIDSGTGDDDGLGLDILQGNVFVLDASIDQLLIVNINSAVKGVPKDKTIRFILKSMALGITQFIFDGLYNDGGAPVVFNVPAGSSVSVDFISTFNGSVDSFKYFGRIEPQ